MYAPQVLRTFDMGNSRIITDFDIEALVDEQLGWEEVKAVQDYISTHDDARKKYDELMRQKKLLIGWWQQLS